MRVSSTACAYNKWRTNCDGPRNRNGDHDTIDHNIITTNNNTGGN